MLSAEVYENIPSFDVLGQWVAERFLRASPLVTLVCTYIYVSSVECKGDPVATVW